jgi:hypothetical protein
MAGLGSSPSDRHAAEDYLTQPASMASTARSRTPGRLYRYDTILERVPQNLQDMAAALGEFIQEEHPVVGQRHFARHGDVSAANQSSITSGRTRGAFLTTRVT